MNGELKKAEKRLQRGEFLKNVRKTNKGILETLSQPPI